MTAGEQVPATTNARRPLWPPCAARTLRHHHARMIEGGILAEAITGEAVEVVEPGVTALGCALCHDTVSLSARTGIVAPNCVSSGSCEEIWTKFYPENYTDEDGQPVAPVSPCAGSACGAVILLGSQTMLDGAEQGSGTISAELHGTCQVDRAGIDFRRDGRRILNSMRPEGITADPPPFDGEASPPVS